MRVALVGLGNAGFTLHLPALAGLPGVSVVGACDLDEGRRARAAERFRVPTFDDFGVRSEINMVIGAREAVVTGPAQTAIVGLV